MKHPSTILTIPTPIHPQNPCIVCLLKKQYAAASPEGAIFVVQSHVYPRGEQYNMSSQVYTQHTHTHIKYINYVFAINHSLYCGGPVAAAIVVGKVRPTPINQQKKNYPLNSVVRDPAVKQVRMSSILRAILLVCMWRFNNNIMWYHHSLPSKNHSVTVSLFGYWGTSSIFNWHNLSICFVNYLMSVIADGPIMLSKHWINATDINENE